jgi:hypothetical protein
MKRGWVGAALFLMFSLVACAERQEVAMEHTAVPTPPPTIEPTVTETAVPRADANLSEEIAQDATPITVSATVESTMTPTRFVATTPEPPYAVELPNEAVAFQLKPPSFVGLLEALKQAGRLEFVYSQENGRPSTNSGAILPAIYSDLRKYFSEGFPDAQKMMMENPLSDSYLGQTPILVPVLEDAFLQYINRFATDLHNISNIEGVLEFTAQPIDLDTELEASWLVTIDFLTYHLRDFVLISHLEDGTFQYVPSDLPYFSGRFVEDGDVFFLQSVDLTGEGQKEVLIENEAYLGGGGNSKNLYIYTWAEQKLSLLDIINMEYGGSSFFEPLYEIADFNGDSHEDIKVTQQGAAEFGCAWEQVDIYSWQGTDPQHILDDLPVDTAVCNLWRAMASFNNSYVVRLDVAERISLLERAVSQLSPDQPTERDWLAYALLQLALAYAENGEFSQAQTMLNQIDSLAQTSRYAQFVQENKVSSNDSIISLCRNMFVNAEQMMETEISDFLTEGAIFGVGYDLVPERRLICNLREVTRSIIEQNELPQSQSPVELMESLGLAHELFQSGQLDTDGDIEWIGVLEPESPSLVIFDLLGEEWQIYFIFYPFYFPVLELDFVLQDVISDDQPEIIVQLTEDGTAYYPYEEVVYDVILAGMVDGAFQKIRSEMVYEKTDDLAQVLEITAYELEASTLASISWRQLEGLDVAEDSVYFYTSKLQTAVLTQTDPTVPEKITQLLNYLPPDDPDARPYIEHLTYLLGYFYELSGEGETAVTTYLDLIQQYPTSPWSWLAWARLEPVEN